MDPDRHAYPATDPSTLIVLAPRTAGAPGWLAMLGNAALFQAGWLGCVLGAAQGHSAAAVALVGAIVALHVGRAARPARELALAAVAMVIGLCWDSTLGAAGLLAFNGAGRGGFAPPWILAIWALFATTLNVSLRWLRGRAMLAAALGAVAGPATYWAGARLGAAQFVQPAGAIVTLAIGWALWMPLLVELARRLEGAAGLGSVAGPVQVAGQIRLAGLSQIAGQSQAAGQGQCAGQGKDQGKTDNKECA